MSNQRDESFIQLMTAIDFKQTPDDLLKELRDRSRFLHFDITSAVVDKKDVEAIKDKIGGSHIGRYGPLSSNHIYILLWDKRNVYILFRVGANPSSDSLVSQYKKESLTPSEYFIYREYQDNPSPLKGSS